METEHLEVVPRDLRRQAFYETVVSQIAHAGPEQVWRLIDTSLTVGMAAAWVDTGSIYAELPFDLAAYHLLEDTNPELAARFPDVRDRISNVSYVLRDCSKDVYDRKRADVWEFNLSRNERLGSALRLWLAFDAKLPGELIPILAPSAGKLLLAAAEAADLPFMAAATTNIIAGRLVRQKVAIPAFEESVNSFAASVVAEVNAPESTHEIISGQIVS